MDAEQLGYALFLAAFFLVPLLTKVPYVRRTAVDLVSRLAAEEEPAPLVDEFGQFPVTWYAVARRERLLADVERLRRILATDMGMSAVRQIGNRMAYDRLLLELQELPELPMPLPAARPLDSWTLPAPPAPRTLADDRRWQPVSNVETLDFGWRR